MFNANRPYSRRRFLKCAAVAGLASQWPEIAAIAALPYSIDPSQNIFHAPSDASQWPAYRAALVAWREKARDGLQYDETFYLRPEFKWSASNYACCFLMTCDETFYNWRTGKYTVEELLETGKHEFGGYDSIVLWHAYPRIGVDDRNQFDFYRDLPGGLKGVRKVVDQFHRQNVRVYIDYNPWDTGTRREMASDAEALTEMVKAVEADGIFLDTLSVGGSDLRARLDSARPGVVLEGEDALPLENIHDHHASWAQWFDDSYVPGVLRNKWFERRHMQHEIRRWDHDHSGELHTAWMNGSGTMIWQNVFGSWVPWNARDRSILCAMLPIQRRFTEHFQRGEWAPLVATEQADVFASLWELDGVRLWTLVNRGDTPKSGIFLRATNVPGHRYFDLMAGTKLKSSDLAGRIAPRGIGCFASGANHLLGQSVEISSDAQTPILETNVFEARRVAHANNPAGMIEIAAANLELVMEMRIRECGFYSSTPPKDIDLGDSERFRTTTFKRAVAFGRFAIDETPVTNGAFAEFLGATKYRPKHTENFLKHWKDGAPPQDKLEHPVVYVDLEDAEAFARWAGKHLPTEEQWQYAAQGKDGRKYPWGNEMRPGCCNDGASNGTTPVKAFADGRSAFGCYDMCGNVWEWTASQRSDGHTRFCIIRGGSWYQAKGSGWYADGGPRPVNFAAKFLMTWAGLDRCATIGFRCAVDLEG